MPPPNQEGAIGSVQRGDMEFLELPQIFGNRKFSLAAFGVWDSLASTTWALDFG